MHHYVRYVPFDAATNATDAASVSADGATYTDARFMTTIVTGAAGNKEGNNYYNKTYKQNTPNLIRQNIFIFEC